MVHFARSDAGNPYILVVGDSVSKFTEAFAIPDKSARTVADVLSSQFFARYGVASSIHSDQGGCFESKLFKDLCEMWDIHKTWTSRYRLCSNGQIERQNRTLKKMLRTFVQEYPESWEDHLSYLIMRYKATAHASTNCSPNLLTFGEELRIPANVVFADTALVTEPPACPHDLVEWI